MSAEWPRSEDTSTTDWVECLLLHINTHASPARDMTVLLVFLSSVEVGLIDRLAALATSADTTDWLAPVSGMQLTSRPLPQAPGGPSHSGISGVGLFVGA